MLIAPARHLMGAAQVMHGLALKIDLSSMSVGDEYQVYRAFVLFYFNTRVGLIVRRLACYHTWMLIA